jgi:hypothetical protein
MEPASLVKLSIDGKVIAKARAKKKKAEEKHHNAPILHYKKKWTKNNIIFIKTTSFSFIN